MLPHLICINRSTTVNKVSSSYIGQTLSVFAVITYSDQSFACVHRFPLLAEAAAHVAAFGLLTPLGAGPLYHVHRCVAFNDICHVLLCVNKLCCVFLYMCLCLGMSAPGTLLVCVCILSTQQLQTPAHL